MTLEIKDLKDSNDFLNLLLDNMDTAVLIADENLKIHEFNESFLSLFAAISAFTIYCVPQGLFIEKLDELT